MPGTGPPSQASDTGSTGFQRPAPRARIAQTGGAVVRVRGTNSSVDPLGVLRASGRPAPALELVCYSFPIAPRSKARRDGAPWREARAHRARMPAGFNNGSACSRIALAAQDVHPFGQGLEVLGEKGRTERQGDESGEDRGHENLIRQGFAVVGGRHERG
jgi:hypothetical protein